MRLLVLIGASWVRTGKKSEVEQTEADPGGLSGEKGKTMKITITLETDNAAFCDNPGEVKRILKSWLNRGHHSVDDGALMDINGNKVGTVDIEEG